VFDVEQIVCMYYVVMKIRIGKQDLVFFRTLMHCFGSTVLDDSAAAAARF
jgi:hypothetical protein